MSDPLAVLRELVEAADEAVAWVDVKNASSPINFREKIEAARRVLEGMKEVGYVPVLNGWNGAAILKWDDDFGVKIADFHRQVSTLPERFHDNGKSYLIPLIAFKEPR